MRGRREPTWKGRGYEILQYNYRCRAGEIDIVARDGSFLVFCEVKYRKTAGKGWAVEAVTPGKQRTISRCALVLPDGASSDRRLLPL